MAGGMANGRQCVSTWLIAVPVLHSKRLFACQSVNKKNRSTEKWSIVCNTLEAYTINKRRKLGSCAFEGEGNTKSRVANHTQILITNGSKTLN